MSCIRRGAQETKGLWLVMLSMEGSAVCCWAPRGQRDESFPCAHEVGAGGRRAAQMCSWMVIQGTTSMRRVHPVPVNTSICGRVRAGSLGQWLSGLRAKKSEKRAARQQGCAVAKHCCHCNCDAAVS